MVILVVLMPVVEETLFRGLLFGSSRRYSRVLGYVLSTLVYAVYCVWQFVFTYGQVDFRYLLLLVQYLPMSLALTWCSTTAAPSGAPLPSTPSSTPSPCSSRWRRAPSAGRMQGGL